MLSQERYHYILKQLEEKSFVSIDEICSNLNVSESTIRRDIVNLAADGKIQKVRGGAMGIRTSYFGVDESLRLKRTKNVDQKQRIGRYAASLIEDGDFIYLDAGTTTEQIVSHIRAKDVMCVTNSVSIAETAVEKCKTVILLGGEFKAVTGAVVGLAAQESIKNYNFAKGFFGMNAIDVRAGYSSPELKEALLKREAISRCMTSYVLADNTKLNHVSAFTVANLQDAVLVTTWITDAAIRTATRTIEVDAIGGEEGDRDDRKPETGR